MTPADLAVLARYLAHGRHPDAPPALYDACRAAVMAAQAPRTFATATGAAWPHEGYAHLPGPSLDELPRLSAPVDFSRL